MTLNKKIIITLSIFSTILISLLIAATLIPIETKYVRECGEIKKIRYSIILGEEVDFEAIEEYSEGDLYGGMCFRLNYGEVNLYIL